MHHLFWLFACSAAQGSSSYRFHPAAIGLGTFNEAIKPKDNII
jgi:hypothetical protein